MKKKYSFWLVLPGLILSCLISVLFLMEWIKIGIIADPAVIESYNFGSESMAENAWYYESPDTYAISAMIQGFIASIITIFFFVTLYYRTKKWLMISYTLLLLGILATLIV